MRRIQFVRFRRRACSSSAVVVVSRAGRPAGRLRQQRRRRGGGGLPASSARDPNAGVTTVQTTDLSTRSLPEVGLLPAGPDPARHGSRWSSTTAATTATPTSSAPRARSPDRARMPRARRRHAGDQGRHRRAGRWPARRAAPARSRCRCASPWSSSTTTRALFQGVQGRGHARRAGLRAPTSAEVFDQVIVQGRAPTTAT